MTSSEIAFIRQQFPILQKEVYGKPLTYLDSGASSQKPQTVIDCINDYYTLQNTNIHRGSHFLANEATESFEAAREITRNFINAKNSFEIIFTKGTTDSINLVAFSFAESFVNEGDEILITAMEHHANIVPWQMACQRKKANLRVIPIDENGELILDNIDELLNERTRLFAFTQVSNVLGTVNPVEVLIEKAHKKNIPVLLDGAQAVPHVSVDVQKLDCDFYCFSGHKMYAPMGVGVLYGKEEFLNKMVPYQGGGEMIKDVTFEKTTYNELPYKFEAGTPNVGGVLGLARAISFMTGIGIEKIAAHENELLKYATKELHDLEDVTIYGNARKKAGVISFLLNGIHPFDAGTIIDHFGIAVRTGHHCAQPIMDFYNIPGTIRASFAVYNNFEDIDRLIAALKQVKVMFG